MSALKPCPFFLLLYSYLFSSSQLSPSFVYSLLSLSYLVVIIFFLYIFRVGESRHSTHLTLFLLFLSLLSSRPVSILHSFLLFSTLTFLFRHHPVLSFIFRVVESRPSTHLTSFLASCIHSILIRLFSTVTFLSRRYLILSSIFPCGWQSTFHPLQSSCCCRGAAADNEEELMPPHAPPSPKRTSARRVVPRQEVAAEWLTNWPWLVHMPDTS